MARTRNSDATETQRRRIMDAAETVLRRHGPARTTVVDVAREIGQSHASVYRYFASKSELIDALVERWLETVSAPLESIARGPGTAAERLRAWLLGLFRAKVRKVTEDPEHFATYHAIGQEAHEVVARHVAEIGGQVEAIVASGVNSGEFRVADPRRAASAILSATASFHHPALLAGRARPPTEQEAEDVIALVLAGLRDGVL
jgi:AcrR family transcriptional regulator